jgi:hypothetical protein
VAGDGENQIVVAPGASAGVLSTMPLNDLPDGRRLLTCLEIPMPSVVAAVGQGRIGLQSVVNPAPAQRLPTGMLAWGPI